MTSSNTRLLRATLVVGSLFAQVASAQPEPTEEVTVVQPMRMEILVGPGVHDSGRPVNAELLLRSSDTEVLEVKQVDFVLEPDHFVCDEPDVNGVAADGGGAAKRHIGQAVVASWEPATAVVLQPGSSQRRFLSIPSRLSRCTFEWSSILRLLAMNSGTFNVRAEAVLAGDRPPVTGQASIRFDAPFRVVFVGALVGNLLVTFLLALLGLARSIETQPAWKAIAHEFLVHAGVRLPIGFTAATIALVLSRASLDVPGLVSVEVNDFLGGVVVGLFAQAASRPIAEWLTGSRPPERQGAEEAGRAPGEPAKVI